MLNMNETSWHIPRPSLSGSSSGEHSSNSSSKSHSNPSTVNRNSRYFRQGGHINEAYVSTYDIYLLNDDSVSRYPKGSYNLAELHSSADVASKQHADSVASSKRSKSIPGRPSPPNLNTNGDKRGSRSSRGSTDSNSSTHSGASESLLLTAANLERFAAIHKKTPLKDNSISNFGGLTTQNLGAVPKHNNSQTQGQLSASQNGDAIIAIDPNLHFVKTKDVDSVSIASSTHFTMVNGIGRPPRKTKSGICSRSHQITVLILTMSTVFLVGILFAVYLLEMRARSMPR